MNIFKIFTFNVCILMSFPNIFTMQLKQDLCSEDNLELDTQEELDLLEDSEELDLDTKEEVIKKILVLQKNIIKLANSSIKSIKEKLTFIKNKETILENALLKTAEENLMNLKPESPGVKGVRERRGELKIKFKKKLDEKNNEKKDLQEITEEKLKQWDLQKLKDLYEELNNKFDVYDSSSEDYIPLSKNEKNKSKEVLNTSLELNPIKIRQITQEDLSKEIHGTTVINHPGNNVRDEVDSSEEISDVIAPIPNESNIEETNVRRYKFTSNGSFYEIPSVVNMLAYFIKSPINTARNDKKNDHEECIKAIKKAVSPTKYFPFYHRKPDKLLNNQSSIKLDQGDIIILNNLTKDYHGKQLSNINDESLSNKSLESKTLVIKNQIEIQKVTPLINIQEYLAYTYKLEKGKNRFEKDRILKNLEREKNQSLERIAELNQELTNLIKQKNPVPMNAKHLLGRQQRIVELHQERAKLMWQVGNKPLQEQNQPIMQEPKQKNLNSKDYLNIFIDSQREVQETQAFFNQGLSQPLEHIIKSCIESPIEPPKAQDMVNKIFTIFAK